MEIGRMCIMTAHIESKKEDIAEIVIMPGDPLRAKAIAEKYLKNVKQVNSVRNMYAYTGELEGKKMTVFASGMGIPSIGIYAYELYKFYDVKKIIRVGSCGSQKKEVRIGDVVLAESATAHSNFAQLFSGETRDCFESSASLNKAIKETAEELGTHLVSGPILTSDVFDVYVDHEKFIQNFPKKEYLACEMEAYALFYLANLLGREASCLLTVVDSKYQPDEIISAADRQNSLDEMIRLALFASIK